ncbi:hypothetical protein HDK64DRAFT_27000 [Phyllosticta capitalensis]
MGAESHSVDTKHLQVKSSLQEICNQLLQPQLCKSKSLSLVSQTSLNNSPTFRYHCISILLEPLAKLQASTLAQSRCSKAGSTALEYSERPPLDSGQSERQRQPIRTTNQSSRLLIMCRYYAHTHSCGHTTTVFAAYCPSAAMRQRACSAQGASEIWQTLKMETSCAACGGDEISGGVSTKRVKGRGKR